MENVAKKIREKKGFICDMDGVIYHGNNLIDGVHGFVNWLLENEKQFVFLTNSSERTPLELSQKLKRMGLDVPEKHFYTSALATASFLKSQCPGCSAYVIGEAGLMNSLYDAGIYMNDVNPDYVVMGDTRTYNFEKLEKAIALVNKGAKLIGTNPDITGPTEVGIMPAVGALIAPIEIATGKKAYFVGKPNPLMLRHAIRKLDCHSAETVMIGDRMDTDIIAGMESHAETVLVLSGCTSEAMIGDFPFRPTYILNSVADIVK
ncbi:MAG: HAD family hydrolase [Ruminococcaceae bacterium]|nr:HAD family hydrolase [Oscillospiraceae bacterium]